MKRVLLLACLASVAVCSAMADDSQIALAIRLGELEPLDFSYESFHAAKAFIEKCNLTKDEIALVGAWLPNHLMHPNPADMRQSILGVDFLPNRVVIILNKAPGGTEYSLFGEWRVVQGELEVRMLGRLLDTGRLSANNVFERREDKAFVPVWKIERYHLAYFQQKPFDWHLVNDRSGGFYQLGDTDVQRSRFTQSPGLPSFYEILDARPDLQKILLDAKPESDGYLKQLFSAMHDSE